MLIMVCKIQNEIAINTYILPLAQVFISRHVGGISAHCGYAFVADCYKCLNHVFVVTIVSNWSIEK